MFNAYRARRARVALSRSACALTLWGLLALVPACGLWSHPRAPRPTFSPNGEPLVGPAWPAHCDDALDAWFDRVDSNHDGRLTRDELEADAVVQFKAMDLRHDGKVTAAELSDYRQKIMGSRYASISTPEAGMRARARRDSDSDGEGYPGGGRRRSEDDTMPRPDAAGNMPADQPDPVMSADTDLDGSVTLDEFRLLVRQNFTEMDRDRVGYIEKSDLHHLCRGGD